MTIHKWRSQVLSFPTISWDTVDGCEILHQFMVYPIIGLQPSFWCRISHPSTVGSYFCHILLGQISPGQSRKQTKDSHGDATSHERRRCHGHGNGWESHGTIAGRFSGSHALVEAMKFSRFGQQESDLCRWFVQFWSKKEMPFKHDFDNYSACWNGLGALIHSGYTWPNKHGVDMNRHCLAFSTHPCHFLNMQNEHVEL